MRHYVELMPTRLPFRRGEAGEGGGAALDSARQRKKGGLRRRRHRCIALGRSDDVNDLTLCTSNGSCNEFMWECVLCFVFFFMQEERRIVSRRN